MDRKDFLLLAVHAAEGQSVTPVQLQKSLFMIRKANLPETPEPFYNFDAYHYGPFDVNIYHDADLLQQEDLVIRSPSMRGTWTDTFITPTGQSRAILIEERLPESTKRYIREVVTWVRSQTFNELVRNIYGMFPEFRQNSVLQG